MTYRNLAISALLTVSTVGGALVFWDLHKLLTWSTTAAYNLSLSAWSANQTVAALNAPCVGFHGSETCGVLAQASQTTKNLGIVAGLAAQQVKQSATLINASTGAVNSAADAVRTLSERANQTADAVTTLLGTANTTVAAAQAPINALTPLLGHSDAAVSDLDALLKDEALHQTIVNVDLTTASMAGVTGDLRKVSDKLTGDLLAPKPWYRKVLPSIGDFWDIAAAAARSAP